MLIDKRFSFDESIKSNFEWNLIEEEFILQCKNGGILLFLFEQFFKFFWLKMK